MAKRFYSYKRLTNITYSMKRFYLPIMTSDVLTEIVSDDLKVHQFDSTKCVWETRNANPWINMSLQKSSRDILVEITNDQWE